MTTLRFQVNTTAALRAAMLEMHRVMQETGGMWELRACTVSPNKRIAMRNALHGIVLPTIATQAMVWCESTRRTVLRTPSAWKELFRELLIPPVVRERISRTTGEARLVLVKRSTEDLTDDEYHDFLLMVQAIAVVDLNVVFPEEPTQ